MSAKKRKKQKGVAEALLSNHRWVFLFILTLVFITYGNSIQNDYNIDDSYVVSLDEGNQLSNQGIGAIPKILLSRYNEGKGVTVGYRPMSRVTMAIEYSIWGNNPQASHFINVLLYALNVFLLFLFIKRISEMSSSLDPPLILLAIVLFIVHPIHTEVVCSIKNREEMLAFIFLLLALLSFSKQSPLTWKRGLYIAFMLLFAFLSKETAMVVFLLIPLITALKYKASGDRPLLKSFFTILKERRNVLALAIAAMAFILVFVIVPSCFLPPDDTVNQFEQVPYKFFVTAHRIPNIFATLFFYLDKLFIPVHLGFYYGYDMIPDTTWNSWIPYVGIGMVIGLGGLVYYSLKQRKYTFELFWLLFFLLTLLLIINVMPALYITGTVAERLVYISSAAFCILLARSLLIIADVVLSKLIKKGGGHRNYYMVGSMVIIPFLLLTIQRNSQWQDKRTLYEHDIKYLQRSARANLMLSNNYMKEAQELENGIRKKQLVEKGKSYLIQAIGIYPEYDQAWMGLGMIYTHYRTQLDSAVLCLNKVTVASNIYYPQAQEVLGDLYHVRIKDDDIALEHYKDALVVDKTNRPVYDKIMEICFDLQRYADIEVVAQSVSDNGWPEVYLDLGDAMLHQLRLDEAMDYYLLALRAGHRSDQVINMVNGQLTAAGDAERLNELQEILAGD